MSRRATISPLVDRLLLRPLMMGLPIAVLALMMLAAPAAAEITEPEIEILVEAPGSSTVGQPVTVTATVLADGQPVAGELVSVSRQATIAGVTGQTQLASARTGADGIVTLEFVQQAESSEPGLYLIEYRGSAGQGTAEFELAVNPGPQQYVATAGVDTGPANVSWLFIVLAVVWAGLLFSVFQLLRVARAAPEGSRGFAAAPHIMIGFVAFTALGMFLVVGTRPSTHQVLSPTEPFERNPAALLGVDDEYEGWRAHGEPWATGLDAESLYIQSGCAGCHGLAGSGAGVVGGHLASLSTLGDAEAFAQLVRLGPAGMPAYSEMVLSDVEIQQIREWAVGATVGQAVDLDLPLVAVPGGPYAGDPQVGIIFDGTASRSSEGAIVAYRWDFGDGGPVVDFGEASAVVEHSYLTAGTYTVTLTVISDTGAEASGSTTATIGRGHTAAAPATTTSGPETTGPETGPTPGTESTVAEPEPPADGDAALGADVFDSQCAACHGPGAIGGDLAASQLTADELRSIILDGSGAMPSFAGQLTDDELAAVVEYITTLQGG